MMTSGNIRRLEELASSQWGMFTAAQALGVGVGRTQVSRMLASGRVESVRRATYRFTVGEETRNVAIKAAWLSLYPGLTAYERMRLSPPDAIAAGPTAAFLHGIGDLPFVPLTFATAERRKSTAPDMEVHTWRLGPEDVTRAGSLPATTVERTVADLARLHYDPSHVAGTIADAARKGVAMDTDRLRLLLGDVGRRGLLADAIGEYEERMGR